MSDIIPEIKEVESLVTALATINETITNLEMNRQLLLNTRNALTDDTSELDNIIETIRSEIADIFSQIPADLPEEDAIEWLKFALIDIIENNT